MSRDLIIRYLTGELTLEEKKDLLRLLHESPAFREEFEELQTAWHHSAEFGKKLDTHKAFAREHIFSHTQEEKAKPAPNPRKFYSPYLQIAASLLVLIALSFFGSKLLERRQFTGELAVTYTSYDTIKKITLTDGSEVWLNRNSSLTLHRKYNRKERNVLLSGEGFFEVEHDPHKPFIVSAGEATTRVLGTSFMVEQQENGDVMVRVESGRVAFYGKKNRRVEIIRGQRAVLKADARTPVKGQIENTNYLSWKTRELVFENASLNEVVRDLEQFYRVEIHARVEDPGKYELNARFVSEPLEEVLDLIAFTLDIRYTKQADGSIEISDKE